MPQIGLYVAWSFGLGRMVIGQMLWNNYEAIILGGGAMNICSNVSVRYVSSK